MRGTGRPHDTFDFDEGVLNACCYQGEQFFEGRIRIFTDVTVAGSTETTVRQAGPKNRTAVDVRTVINELHYVLAQAGIVQICLHYRQSPQHFR
jgi:hypothetical protein